MTKMGNQFIKLTQMRKGLQIGAIGIMCEEIHTIIWVGQGIRAIEQDAIVGRESLFPITGLSLKSDLKADFSLAEFNDRRLDRCLKG